MSEFVIRGLLTAFAVALVLQAARRAGLQASGALAGLPVTTLPALLWLATTRGEVFAAQAATGAVIASAAWASLAGLYVLGALRVRPAIALWGASLPALGVAAVGSRFEAMPALVLLGATLICGSVLRCLRDVPAVNCAGGASGPSRWLVPAVAGTGSAVISALALVLPPVVCGLLAALPVIGASGAWVQHNRGGTPAVALFARGYVAGLLAKAAFCASFAELLLRLPWPGALLLAAVAATACGTSVGLWACASTRPAARPR